MPELRLLLACTWIAPATQVSTQAERIAAVCENRIDWDVFLSLIERHRILVPYDVLRHALGDRLPIGVYEQLKVRKDQACKLALAHTTELIRLNRAFRAHRLDMLPIKGMMLSLQLFGDSAMRLAQDIDFLIKPSKWDEADRILQDEGYRRVKPSCILTPKRKRWLLQQSTDFGYYHDDRHQLIELHWSLSLWTEEQIAELWNHCRQTNWIGTSFLNLNDDALLLFLCDHGAKHQWGRIKWLADVASLIAQKRSVAWENLLTLAGRLDLTLALSQTGLLLHWLYGMALPQPWLALVANEKRSVALASSAMETMLLGEREQFTLLARLKTVVYSARMRKRLSSYLFLKSWLLSADEFKEFPLPDSLFWIYFPLRPLLWIYHNYIKRGA